MKGSSEVDKIGVDFLRQSLEGNYWTGWVINRSACHLLPFKTDCAACATPKMCISEGSPSTHQTHIHVCLIPRSCTSQLLDRNSRLNSAYFHSPCLSVDIKVNFFVGIVIFWFKLCKSCSLYLRQTGRQCADAGLTPQTINRRRNCLLPFRLSIHDARCCCCRSTRVSWIYCWSFRKYTAVAAAVPCFACQTSPK